jgi:hypothetical protein
MTDLITSTFAQLCCFYFPCSRDKRERSDEESDAEALEKARQWREKMAMAENGGRPPAYQPPREMSQMAGEQDTGRHVRGNSGGENHTNGDDAPRRPGS